MKTAKATTRDKIIAAMEFSGGTFLYEKRDIAVARRMAEQNPDRYRFRYDDKFGAYRFEDKTRKIKQAIF